MLAPVQIVSFGLFTDEKLRSKEAKSFAMTSKWKHLDLTLAASPQRLRARASSQQHFQVQHPSSNALMGGHWLPVSFMLICVAK